MESNILWHEWATSEERSATIFGQQEDCQWADSQLIGKYTMGLYNARCEWFFFIIIDPYQVIQTWADDNLEGICETVEGVREFSFYLKDLWMTNNFIECDLSKAIEGNFVKYFINFIA